MTAETKLPNLWVYRKAAKRSEARGWAETIITATSRPLEDDVLYIPATRLRELIETFQHERWMVLVDELRSLIGESDDK